MPWKPSDGFHERTLQHHTQVLLPLLEDRDAKIIITHAGRGIIRGRTTAILEKLSHLHGLREVTMLLPQDAPHNKKGYAIEISSRKVRAVAAILQPFKRDLLNAAKENRLLVAGKFSWRILSSLSAEIREAMMQKRIVYPCYWMRRPLTPIHSKLEEILGSQVPSQENLASYILAAHREALVNRWNRMTRVEKLCHRLKLKAAYAALPEEEKERRSQAAVDRYAALPVEEKGRRAQGVSDRYAALPEEEKDRRADLARETTSTFWKGVSAVEKLRRMQLLSRSIRSGEGKARWRASLRAAKAAMKPEVRERVFAAMRLGYRDKMTPERQRELGDRKRLAWSVEARAEAAAREKRRHEEDPTRGQRVMERARAVKASKQNIVNKQRLETCARKLLTKIRERLASSELLELDKRDRRTWREQSGKFLDLASDKKISLQPEEVEIFEKAVKAALDCGATSKSKKLKARHESARQG
jgi:hypothetical protein